METWLIVPLGMPSSCAYYQSISKLVEKQYYWSSHREKNLLLWPKMISDIFSFSIFYISDLYYKANVSFMTLI